MRNKKKPLIELKRGKYKKLLRKSEFANFQACEGTTNCPSSFKRLGEILFVKLNGKPIEKHCEAIKKNLFPDA